MIVSYSLPLFIAGAVSFIFFLFFIMLVPKINKSDIENNRFLSSYRTFLSLSLVNAVYNISFGLFLNSGINMILMSMTNRIIVITALFILVIFMHFIIKFYGLKAGIVLPFVYALNVLFSVLTLINADFFLYDEFAYTSSYYTGLKTGIFFPVCGIYMMILLVLTG